LALQGKLKLIPPTFLTEENLKAKTSDGTSVYHCCATQGNLEQIPKELINNSSILLKDKEGNSVLHVLAQHGGLNKIDPKFLSPEILELRTSAGRNILHEAGRSAKPKSIPKHLLTYDYISQKTTFGHTLIDFLLESGETKLTELLKRINLAELEKIVKDLPPISTKYTLVKEEIKNKRRQLCITALHGQDNSLTL
jgi:ankyrin repeat protein